MVDRAGQRRDDRLGPVLSDAIAVALGDQPHCRKHAALGCAVRDLATVRDLARSRAKQLFYGILALGWRGSVGQWRNQCAVHAIMSAIMAPMVISVHSVVGLDYAGGLTLRLSSRPISSLAPSSPELP
jgi:hypothetical protein